MQKLRAVKFWIKAFIPDPSLTEFVMPAPGASEGLSMIVIPATQSGLPVPVNRCFLGDNRGFSDNVLASARIHSEVTLSKLDQDTPVIESIEIHCGPSHEIDANSGEIIKSATASAERIRFSALRGNMTVDSEGGIIEDSPSSRFVQIEYEAAANLPLLPVSPDIDLLGVLSVDRDAGKLRFQGAVDDFPAFEAYVSFNDGPALTLFQRLPVAPLLLIGDVKRKIDVAVDIVVPD